jgi:hypothetical protein
MVAARSMAQVYGRSPAAIVGSNPIGAQWARIIQKLAKIPFVQVQAINL